jgi:Uma2 family endonuclease
MSESVPRYTYRDLQSFDATQRWELIDGQPYAMSGASRLHQELSRELLVHLTSQFRKTNCRVFSAPFDVRLSEHDVVQPDLLVTCGDGLRPTHHEGAPDLVIEICSPSTIRHDRLRKLNLYAASGVAEYWIVTPHPLLVEVLQNDHGSFLMRGVYSETEQLRGHRFPELRLNLAEIAAALPPQPPIPDEVRETVPVYASERPG